MALLDHQEIPEGWSDFKERWYKTAADLEGLKDIKSGLGEDFLNAIKGIGGEASGIVEDGERLIASVRRIAPDRGEDIKAMEERIASALQDVSKDIGDIASHIEGYREVSLESARIRQNLEGAEKEFREQENLAKEACNRLEEARKGYEAKTKNIKNATRVKLVNIRKGFVSELEPIFEGYDIVGNTSMGVGELFDALVEDPSYHEKVTVVSRGFGLGKKKSDAVARGLLLGYKAKEVIERVKPLHEEERRRRERFAGEEENILALEVRCHDRKDEAERLRARVDGFKEELAGNQAKAKEVEAKLSSYDQVLSMRDRLLKKFNQGGGAVKSLGTLIEESVEGYEPVERDVEKRELKAELRTLAEEKETLTETKKDLESRVETLTRDVERYGMEIERMSASMDSYREDREKLTSENTILKTELNRTANDLEKALDREAALEREKVKLKKALEKAVNRYEVPEKELERYKKALQDREREYQALEARYQESSAELEDLRAEIQRLDDEMMSRIRALESDIRRQTSGMLRAKTRGKKPMTQEEKKVEKKLNALRDKKA